MLRLPKTSAVNVKGISNLQVVNTVVARRCRSYWLGDLAPPQELALDNATIFCFRLDDFHRSVFDIKVNLARMKNLLLVQTLVNIFLVIGIEEENPTVVFDE